MGSKSNRMKIDPKVFLGLVSHQRNNPAICTDLKKLGIGDALIPDWVTVTAVNNSVCVDAGVGVSIMVLMVLRVSMVSHRRSLSPLEPLYV